VEGFDFVHREPVRFRDLDPMGHVNNAVFLTYLEQARIAYLFGRGASTESIIVARIEIDYRAPVRLGETIDVGVRAARVGTKSFDLEYELRVDDRVVGQAKSVNVFYDYGRREPAAIPDEWRRQLTS
jgi:acyl-CoA thioester hydrolase